MRKPLFAALMTLLLLPSAGATANISTGQREVTALNVRFVDNGDGTISDNETGLMWEKRARDGSLHDVGTVWQTWSSSGTAPDGTIWTRFIGGLNAGDGFAGHKDWRIPNLTELQGILDNSLPPPKMPPVFNNGCVDGCTVTTCSCPHGGFVWTATPAENNSSYAWVVFFNEGRSLTEGKWNGAAVRAVRTMDVPVESGLVAYYPFSGDARDASGHGNDGTPTTPSLTADRFGSPGQAYNFKADVGSYIRVPNSSSLELPGDFSVSLWVKFNQGWGYHTEALIWKLSGTPPWGTTGWHLGLNEDSGYTAGFLLMNPGIHLAASQGVEFERDWLGRWNHVVGVRSAGQLNFFVNGSLLASAADGGLSVSSAGDLIIGGSSHPVSGAYDRDIDDIRIYDGALTSTQVAQLFALESASAACGNSVLESGEDCDDGNTVDGDGCDSNCTITGCGNAVLTNGEHCDDGNLTNGDGCNSTCQLETRFIDNGDGTISDTQTNLMWEKKSHDGSLHDYGTGWRTWSSSGTAPDGTMWTQFLSGLNQGLGFAGYTDWRIPELAELQGIRDGTLPPPGMDPVFNQGCTAGCTVLTCSCPHGGFVWSATTYADNPSYAWVVFFNENRALPEGKWNGAVIRAVRTITSTPPAADCGDGVVESGEDCDDGNTANGDCCSATCRYESAGTVCRSAQGVCDVEETCTGSSATCPANAFLPPGTVCRGVAGVCDVAESCSGTAAACPADTKAAKTTVCRTSGSSCDPAETCDGFGDSCPTDDACEAPTTPVLRTHRIYYRTRPVAGDLWGYGLNGAEDYRTIWQKAMSVNPVAPSGFGDFEMNVWNQNNPGGEHGNLFYYIRVEFELTATADLAVNPYPDFGWGGAVFLDGQPVSVSVSDLPYVGSLAFSRRLNAGFHVLEEYGGDYCCDGWNSGSYTLNGGTVPPYGGAIFSVERCGNGVVEAGEQCDLGYLTNGEFPSCCTAACGFASEATNCRDQRGSCDTQEYCTGTSATCPDDRVASSAVICRSSAGICDPSEYCTGADDWCPADAVEPSTTVCRASAGVCDLVENCTGSSATCPTDTFAAVTVTCREPGGVCDVAESCTGSTVSCPPDVFASSATACRDSAGVCDTVETCTGSGVDCPADVFAPTTTTCRGSAGICDTVETCTGSEASCPDDTFVASTTVCRGSAGVCDVNEACTGSTSACPADVVAPSTTLCRSATGVCDAAEYCSGSTGACPTDGFLGSSAVCRSAAAVCDAAESCTGSAASCPADRVAAVSTLCRAAGSECDAAETCDGSSKSCPADAAIGVGEACADDNDVCTDDLCDSSGGCVHLFNSAPCDDGDRCTLHDTCTSGACVGTDVIVKPACRWALIGGSGINPQRPKQVGGRLLSGSTVVGDVCGATMRIGVGAYVAGGIVATSAACDLRRAAVQLTSDDAGVYDASEKIVTGGGPVAGVPIPSFIQGGDRRTSIDCGSRVVPSSAPPMYYDTTGADPLVDRCMESRLSLASYVAGLETSLASATCSAYVDPAQARVVAPAVLRIGPDHPESLVAGSITRGVLNYVCIDGSLQGRNNARIEIDDGGDTSTEYVLVVSGKVYLRLNTTLAVVPPMDASRLLIYGRRSCKIGDNVTGEGSLLCPKSKLKVQSGVIWNGAFLSGHGYVQLGTGTELSHVPLLFTH